MNVTEVEASAAPERRNQARPSFIDVLETVPLLFDLADGWNVALTCWGALTAYLRHGERRPVFWPLENCPSSGIVGVGSREIFRQEARSTPVLHVRRLDGALMRGLAGRISAGSQYVGRLEFSGAYFSVDQAGALYRAACRAGLHVEDVATPSEQICALQRALQDPELRVDELWLASLSGAIWGSRQNLARHIRGSDKAYWTFQSLLLGTPAVRNHVRDVQLAEFDNSRLALGSEIEMNSDTKEAGDGLTRSWDTHSVRDLPLCDLRELQVLDAEQGTVTKEVGLAIARLVRESSTLRELFMNDGDEIGVAAIGEAVCASHTVRALHFANAIPPTLSPCADRLTHLRVYWIDFTERPSDLLDLIARSSKLESIELGDCSMGDLDLFRAIADNSVLPLRRLGLRGCGYGWDGLAFADGSLAAMLAQTPSLEDLVLDGRVLAHQHMWGRTRFKASHLADAVAGNNTLRTLNVCCCFCEEDDEGAFDRLLRAVGSSKLQDVAIQHRVSAHTDVTSCTSLHSVLANLELRSLRLRTHEAHWGLPTDMVRLQGLDRFARDLAAHPSLRILSFSGFSWGVDGVVSLARALRANPVLRSFALECAGLGDELGAQFADELCHNTALQHLSLRNNPDTGDLTAAALIRVPERHPTLEDLRVEGCGFYGDAWKSLTTNLHAGELSVTHVMDLLESQEYGAFTTILDCGFYGDAWADRHYR